ncbi:MAG: hypothetical protein JJE13_11160 [Thermoleophilia bacterium]|nr:hypothetical protein [Thermoleophilia bacterium]
MKELRIDRERAIKVAAVAGLVVLGLSVLPGLLKTPEAPELPPDVGFTAAETGPATLLPVPGKAAKSHSGTKKSARNGDHGKGVADSGDAGRKHRHGTGRKGPRKPGKPDIPARKRAKAPASTTPPPVSTAAPPATAAQPAPAPAPVTPAPTPAPAPPAPSPTPGDGSQEFAPR